MAKPAITMGKNVAKYIDKMKEFMNNPMPAPAGPRFGPKGDMRRQALIEAGYRVVFAQGLGALTFRAVAQEARVPLGSASYYFTDKNALLLEIVAFARKRVADHYAGLEAEVTAGRPWREALAAHVAWITSSDHMALRRDYEMFLIGFQDPALHEISRHWITLENPALRRLLPEDLRLTVCYVLEGIYLAAAKTERCFTATEVLAILQQIGAPRS